MKRLIIVISIFIILFSDSLLAGPTIIRDTRITDLALTPTLGRGYTIVTNTFQSKCMANVVLTDPSYDFQYKFESIDTTKARFMKTAVNFGLEVPIEGGGTEAVAVSETTNTEGVEHKHHIYVEINMDTYYASVDESQTQLSGSAAQLLSNNDIPGFFSSCGPYYVRSIGRHATFISIFSYQSESTTRDENFEDNLRTEISRFSTSSQKKSGAGAVIGPGLSVGWSAAKSSKSASDKSREVVDQQRRESFNSNAESYRLTINTSAYGLGKDKKATLISFDMDSFKSAVKDAFMSMQNPRTGKVGSIEVVPWVENTEFQALVNLEQEEIPQEGALKDATGDTAKKPEVKLLYEKKLILNSNAEFFMEIERTDRNKLNMYYKAKLCKKNIDVNFKVDGSLKPEYGNALLVNHRGGDLIQLTLLDEKLTEEFVEEYYRKEQKFMFGVKRNKDKPGAAECIRQIMLNGIYQKVL